MLHNQILSKGMDTITCAAHAGAPHYSALETLKNKEYSKQSDMFSVGATIFEWDTHKPFLFSRVICDQDVSFCIDVHENGRKMETVDKINKKWIYAVDQHGLIRRESLVPDRSSWSVFAPILESICNAVPSKRISAMEAMTCSDMCYAFSILDKLAARGMILRPFLYYNSFVIFLLNIQLKCFPYYFVHTFIVNATRV
jgi:serine/threonine protein kinase